MNSDDEQVYLQNYFLSDDLDKNQRSCGKFFPRLRYTRIQKNCTVSPALVKD